MFGRGFEHSRIHKLPIHQPWLIQHTITHHTKHQTILPGHTALTAFNQTLLGLAKTTHQTLSNGSRADQVFISHTNTVEQYIYTPGAPLTLHSRTSFATWFGKTSTTQQRFVRGATKQVSGIPNLGFYDF